MLKLGDGLLHTEKELGEDMIEIPSDLICTGSIVTEIFGSTITADLAKSISGRAILCLKNEDDARLNDEVLDRLEGDCHMYLIDDSVIVDERENLRICNGTRLITTTLKKNLIEAITMDLRKVVGYLFLE